MDRAKPFNAEKREWPRLVSPQRTESESAADKQPSEVREEQSTYRYKNSGVFVRTWESAKLQEGRMSQPWYERLSRIRNGEDPRF